MEGMGGSDMIKLYHIKVFEVCLMSRMHRIAAFACRASPDGSSQNTHFKLYAMFTFALIHPSMSMP